MDPNNPYQQHNQQQPPYNPYAQQNIFGANLPPVPNATAIMVLGICSIIFCTLGPILATIALVMAKNAKAEYEGKPNTYDPSSYNNVKTGRICGIIGLCVGIFAWIAIVCYFMFVFWMIDSLNTRMY
jgi:hypothetical protein